MNDKLFFIFYDLAHRSRLLDQMIVFIAESFPYVVIVLAGIFLVFHYKVWSFSNPVREFLDKWKFLAPAVLSASLAWYSAKILKILFNTERPFVLFKEVIPLFSRSDYSFPSTHSAILMALAVSLFFINKKVGYIFIFFALLVGIARIATGAHFPIDILGGFALGILVSYSIAYFFKKI